MSDDFVKRLRDVADRARKEYPEMFRVSEELAYEAADRIEKLVAALREIGNGPTCCPVSNAMRDIARKALEGKDV